MQDAVTDTHGLVWYLEDDPHLGPTAQTYFEALDRGEIKVHIPTICLVEIVYLEEKGRLLPGLRARLETKLQQGRSGLILADLTIAVADALARIPRAAVPDMPDRIIAATALHLGLPLISKDHKIQAAGIQTSW